jgi:hypothetical protein
MILRYPSYKQSASYGDSMEYASKLIRIIAYFYIIFKIVFNDGETDVSYCCRAHIERISSWRIRTGFVKFSEKYLYVALPRSKLRLLKNTNYWSTALSFCILDI